MIVFNIIIWSIVSAVWAALAWWKKKETYTPIWLVLVRLLSLLCIWWSGGHREAPSRIGGAVHS